MMSVEEVMQTLESLGTEQACKTYKRHGVKGSLFGVSYADQKKLTKKIKMNHSLAQELWDTGNHDARVLALMIADPKQATGALLDHWIGDLNDYVMTDGLSGYIGQTTLGREKMDAWMRSEGEWISTVGWHILGTLARTDQALPDSYFEAYISTIEHNIHGSKNRTRFAMNNALISMGMRNATLEQKAIDAANRIGKVIVDHGDTNCKTPDAVSYIKKANDRKVEKV